MTTLKGLMVFVQGMDCTAGGVTSGKRHACLIGDGMPEIFEARDDMPALALVYDLDPQGCASGYMLAASPQWLGEIGQLDRYDADGRPLCYAKQHKLMRAKAVPVDDNGRPRLGGMFGGHYIDTSDSRGPSASPIPVFDRFEV